MWRGPDLAVIGLNLAVMVWIGVYCARKSKSSDAYFLAGRNMAGWVVGMSMMATIVSSMTFLATPGFTYSENWRYMPANFTYLLAAILFILGLKGLTSPRTAVRGNLLGATGMLLAIVATLADRQIVSYETIALGVAIGAVIGVIWAVKVQMTAMPEMVALLGAAFVRGLQDHGAIATAKHFPGHGDTGVDSHISLPVIRVSRERMDSVELLPFRRAVGAGLGAIMTAHITVPEITGASTPATLAPGVLTGLLRDEMGFGGLVFTDAMDMGAIDRMFERGEATVRAIEAGADVILMPPDLAAAREGIVAAVRSGRLSEERVDRSVLRILRAKERLGLDRERTVDLNRMREVVGVRPHLAVAQAVADRSVTVLKDERDLLPLLGTPTASVYSVTYRRPNDLRASRAFNTGLGRTYGRLRTAYVDQETTRREYDEILARARGMNLTIVSLHVGVRTASGSVALPDEAVRFVKRLARSGRPHIVVAFGNPYLLAEFPRVGTYLTAWSGIPVAERAAADAILGRITVTGRAPTRIAGFEIGDGLRVAPRMVAEGN